MEVPDGAVPVTADRSVMKIVNEEGDRKNNSASYNDTAVAVEFIVRSPEGIVDATEPQEPRCWIIGDKEAESELYMFLPVAVRSMREKEVATFYFPRHYFLGDAPVVAWDGRVDNSKSFAAVVHLLKATPLDQIQAESETSAKKPEQTPKPQETEKKEKPPKKKSEEMDPALAKKCALFALDQLQKGEALLATKPAGARKEFNKARIAWTKQVDVTKTADREDPIANLPIDEAKKFVDVRALYGIAKTFLAVQPQLKEKAILSLREAHEIDGTFTPVIELLRELGIDVQAESGFPAWDDPRLSKPNFWMSPDIDWNKRLEYSEMAKQKGTEYFRENNFTEAMSYYNHSQIPFSGQRVKELPEDKRRALSEIMAIAKLNVLACQLSLEQYRQVLMNGELLLNFLNKTGLDMDRFKVKCYYRMCLAYLKMNKNDEIERLFKEMSPLKGSGPAISDVKAKIAEEAKRHQVEQDFMYQKMTGTVS